MACGMAAASFSLICSSASSSNIHSPLASWIARLRRSPSIFQLPTTVFAPKLFAISSVLSVHLSQMTTISSANVTFSRQAGRRSSSLCAQITTEIRFLASLIATFLLAIVCHQLNRCLNNFGNRQGFHQILLGKAAFAVFHNFIV